MLSINFLVGFSLLCVSPVVGMAAGVIVYFSLVLCTYPVTRWDPFSTQGVAEISAALTLFSVVTVTLALAARSIWLMWV